MRSFNPHVRGENYTDLSYVNAVWSLQPPTHVGKTNPSTSALARLAPFNPHARGENASAGVSPPACHLQPPRVWGKQFLTRKSTTRIPRFCRSWANRSDLPDCPIHEAAP